jgi:hypothetical protein
VRVLLSAIAVLFTFALAACGGDDEADSTTAAGATGTAGAESSASSEMTASEFVAASIPDEIEAVTEAAEANSECANADTAPGSDFQVAVAIDAAQAPPDTPISEVVADNC